MSIRGIFLAAAAALLAPASLLPLHAQEEASTDAPAMTNAPATAEAPSAELIIDAEEAVISEPALAPGEEPLPPMDAPFPGEDNIFGNDLFGTQDTYTPPPAMPERPPLLEDPQESERKMRVQLRRLKAVLDRDPQLFELQEMADRATTPEDRRAARRAYYALFFDKVRKANPKLTDYADKLEKASLNNLYQTRIEPTLALNPPPLPQPQVRFIPKRQFEDYVPADEEPVPVP
ncbi:MAG: hypothetical protein IAE97_03210 [Chthoniobacterales bacterium]|nr:hypothetical protein [Chthoniobacterales bacterium]